MSFIPGFPWYVLIPLAAIWALLGWRMRRKAVGKTAAAEEAASAAAKKQARPAEETSAIAPIDTLALELGIALVPLVDQAQGAELLERVRVLRRSSALGLGVIIPEIHIMDNMALEQSEYSFKIKGAEVARGKIRMGALLCMNPGGGLDDVAGEPTVDPTFGIAAKWISAEAASDAERLGCTVIDPPAVIATHLTEIIKRHAAEILSLQMTQNILEKLKPDNPALVEEAQKALPIIGVCKVLQGLLDEQVSVRNITTILETIVEWAGISKNAQFLVEKCRQALGRQICLGFADEDRTLRALTLEPTLEQKIIDSRMEGPRGSVCALDPPTSARFLRAVSDAAAGVRAQQWRPLIVTSEAARILVRQLTERNAPDLVVLSVPEIVSDINVLVVGQIALETKAE
jgi:flagellar biosynthesis protein FlhA